MKKITFFSIVVLAFLNCSFGDVLFRDDFNSLNFLDGWSINYIGDGTITYYNSSGALTVTNSRTYGGNGQSIVFSRNIDTTGYKDISLNITYKISSTTWDRPDYIRAEWFNGNPPDYLQPNIIGSIPCS